MLWIGGGGTAWQAACLSLSQIYFELWEQICIKKWENMQKVNTTLGMLKMPRAKKKKKSGAGF